MPYALGRIPQFDERSRAFPIRALVAAKAPRSYSWSCGAVLDQGAQGSCVGHAWAHELIARPVVVPGIDHASAVQLYYAAQGLDDQPGGEYPGASPHYEGTSVLAGAKAVQNAGYLTEYRWAFGLDDLVLALGYHGPAVLGIDWHNDMFDPDASGLLHVGGGIAGGHAILANGVSIRKRLVRLHNSWGSNWALNGEAYIGFDDLAALLDAQGEACVPVQRAIPA
jgi:hypothetical protein